jgi:glycosyltransferase involved in cell wall biosynthesis
MSAHVEETIASVLASSYQPLEIIIVNDGSFEAEDALLMDLDRRPELTVVHQVNAGSAAARNTGFALARGRYVLPLDADDVLGAPFIERCVDVLETHPEHAFVTCWARHMDSDGRLVNDAFVFLGNEARTVLDENVAGTPAALMRAEHLDPGNGYTPDLVTHEDWHLYRTMHQRGLYGHVIPEFLLFYRLRAGSMSETMLWPNRSRLAREVRARSRQREVTWTTTR